MDEEARRISEMTDAELEARWNAGTPTKVERKPRAEPERKIQFDEGYYFRIREPQPASGE